MSEILSVKKNLFRKNLFQREKKRVELIINFIEKNNQYNKFESILTKYREIFIKRDKEKAAELFNKDDLPNFFNLFLIFLPAFLFAIFIYTLQIKKLINYNYCINKFMLYSYFQMLVKFHLHHPCYL